MSRIIVEKSLNNGQFATTSVTHGSGPERTFTGEEDPSFKHRKVGFVAALEEARGPENDSEEDEESA